MPRPSERLRDVTKEVASIPEKKTGLGRTLPLERLDRDWVPPNTGTAPAPTSAAPATSSPVASSQSHWSWDVNLSIEANWWFSNPHNRFVCWRSGFGHQFGYVFCGPRIYWYWWWPGCSPRFYPYSYYWWPSSYYFPAYYPSYATVQVVHDYWDDGDYYPTYSEPIVESGEAAAPAPSAADLTALLADGWEQFRTGAYPEAIESFRQAVLADPADPQAKIAFAQSLFAIGNYPDAAFLMRRTVELLPDWPVTGEDPRARYADPADHAEQMVALRAFLERVPGDPAATLVLAVQSYFTGDLRAAREAFEALAALDTEDLVAKRFLERLGPAPRARSAAAPASDGR
jgi:hypothetical protein